MFNTILELISNHITPVMVLISLTANIFLIPLAIIGSYVVGDYLGWKLTRK